MTAPTLLTFPLKLPILKVVFPLLVCLLVLLLFAPCKLLVDLSSTVSVHVLGGVAPVGGVAAVPVSMLDICVYYLQVCTLPVSSSSRYKF